MGYKRNIKTKRIISFNNKDKNFPFNGTFLRNHSFWNENYRKQNNKYRKQQYRNMEILC